LSTEIILLIFTRRNDVEEETFELSVTASQLQYISVKRNTLKPNANFAVVDVQQWDNDNLGLTQIMQDEYEVSRSGNKLEDIRRLALLLLPFPLPRSPLTISS